jgi:hypothetical protein
MSTILNLYKLKQWRRPHKYRSIVAFGPRGIYQVDMMHLYPLWDLIFNEQEKINYRIKDYALVCVDVYSRYVKARSMDYKYGQLITLTMSSIISDMGKPQIISADNEIINSLKLHKHLYPNLNGIQLYNTTPHELNKNAIVERMIRTIKQYLVNILMTYSIKQLYQKYVKLQLPMIFVDYLLEFACEINNTKMHRIIKAIPKLVFDEVETNKQEINHEYYNLYKPGTIVIRAKEGKGAFSNKVFNLELEPYVISDNRGRKYYLIKLIDLIEMRYSAVSKKAYQPYEVKEFRSASEFMKFIASPLVKRYLIKLYGKERYDKIINWFKPRAKAYDDLFK